MVEHWCCPNNKLIITSSAGTVWPGLLTESNAAQVGDEYVGQIELPAGPPEHSVTYRTGRYDGIGTASNSIFEVVLLDVNGKLPVSIDKRGSAADGFQSLVFSVRPFYTDKLEDLIQKGFVLGYPSATAVGLIGNLLAQPGDIITMVPQIVAQVFEEVHVLEGDSKTILLGLYMRQDKALIMKVHNVLPQLCQVVKDPLTVLLYEACPTHVHIAGKRVILTTSHYGHTLE